MENNLTKAQALPSKLQEISQSVTVAKLRLKDFEGVSKLAPRNVQQAIEEGHPISVLEKIVGIERIEAQVEFELIKSLSMLNMNLTLKDHQYPIFAREIVAAFPNESIQDFQLCFKRGCIGAYGTIYNIDLSVLGVWMSKYLDEKYQQIEVNESKAKATDNDSKVDYKAFQIRLEHERALRKESESDRLKAERDRQMKELGYEVERQSYTPPSEEYVRKAELHRQYIRENYDPYTGDRLPGWKEETEWIKQQSK